ncbi:hypothetical protein L0M14_03155 [Paenibacillus hexagrammi]|uniref:Spore germination protein N-terminal domain-containing protein n=1 Tax=Paenibacillus hexagrammi TaxID=2908839 RepID=A0ABY3SLG8_9BACL|nr:hypothetical protein [Paenibacillus sp. YPD9-1]UJF34245.1 hypothetical protein L0M14_03155 [Paenibacillus sp. YPD9-1]
MANSMNPLHRAMTSMLNKIADRRLLFDRVNPRLPALIGVLTSACLLLTGCWDRIETNDVAFVLSSSVDLEDDGKYRVSYLVPLPGSMGGASGGGGGTSGNNSYYIDSETGATMREATSKLQKRMSRKLFLSHRRTIIIGEEMAKRELARCLTSSHEHRIAD